jgi:hypothetical protein
MVLGRRLLLRSLMVLALAVAVLAAAAAVPLLAGLATATFIARLFDGLTDPFIGDTHVQAITQAGLALQSAGVIAADVDVAQHTQALIDPRFVAALPGN